MNIHEKWIITGLIAYCLACVFKTLDMGRSGWQLVIAGIFALAAIGIIATAGFLWVWS